MKRDNNAEVLAGAFVVCGVPTLVFLAWALIAPWRGYALMVVWGWFAVPLGAPALALWQAMGVSLLAAFLTYENPKSDGGFWARIATAVLAPAFLLLFGWLTLVIFK